MKQGWKTSEFLLTVIAQVIAFAVLFGFLSAEEGELIKNSTVEVVALGAPFFVAVSALVMYIWSRTQVKKEAGKTTVVELDAQLKDILEEEVTITRHS